MILAPAARKDLKRIPKADQIRISQAIDRLKRDPYAGNVKQLTDGSGTWRLRVGNYRVRYWLMNETGSITVFAIQRRTTTTYR